MYQSGRIPDYNLKEPMGLMYIEATLKEKNYSTELLDADILHLTINQTIQEIIKRPAQIIGFSIMQRALPSTKKIIQRLKQKGIQSHICCGGITATLSCQHILNEIPEIDFIVLGEGEIIFSNLIKKIKNQQRWQDIPGIAFKHKNEIIINPPSQKPDLNKLAWPTRNILPICIERNNYATILASRGCYGICSFCSNQEFERNSIGANWRGRKAKDIVDEIETLQKHYKIKTFKFNDPNLFGPGIQGRQHVHKLCLEIIKRDFKEIHQMGFCRANDIDVEIAYLMKKAGFERLLIGIESANSKILKIFRKGENLTKIKHSIKILRSVDIDIVPGFMIFTPYTTIETLLNDLKFLEKYNFTPTLSKSLRIFDQTPIQNILKKENRLIWRDPIKGYHEYIVPPIIASIYMALKTISIKCLEPIKKNYQKEIWELKKSISFNQRTNFDKFNKLIFLLEKNTLIYLINWSQNKTTKQEIIKYISKLKKHLEKIEKYLISNSDITLPIIKANDFSIYNLSTQIHSILSNQTFHSFPEKYRWLDD